MVSGTCKERLTMSTTWGSGVGKGHGGRTPNLPVIREVKDTPSVALALQGLEPGTRLFRMGKASIFVSPPFQGKGWHMSIARQDRYPDWDEIAKAWYELVPEADRRTAVMVLPPRDEYINIHSNCFQVHELLDGVLPEVTKK